MKAKWLHWGMWFLALGVSHLFAAGDDQQSAPLATRISQTAVIPAEVSSHGMFVEVMINGQGPFRMLIDTGCSFTVISPEVAAALQTSGSEIGDDDVQALNGLGDALAVPQMLLDSITVGGVEFEGVVAGVVPLELQSKIESRPLDGLLGYSLFSNLFFALDYPNHHLVLSATWPKNLAPVRSVLPITEKSGVPYVTVRLQGRDIKVMVDTGANDAFHLPPDATAKLKWKVKPRPGFLLAVAGGSGREQIARLTGALALGKIRQKLPVAGLSDGPPTIGIGLLHAFCLVFHEGENKLWLCSAKSGTVPAPPVRTVGLSLFADPAGWRIAGIIPHSPAEMAGIKAGDLVIQIEGKEAAAWTPDEIQGLIDTHTTFALRISEPAGERYLNLKVWSLVP